MATLEMESLSPNSPLPSPNTSHSNPFDLSLNLPSPSSCDPATTATPRKVGRRPNFTSTEDIIITLEAAAVRAHNAHVASYGEVTQGFEVAEEKADAHPDLSVKFNGKIVQGRFKTLLDAFERNDTSKRMMLGIGGELGELNKLLLVILV